MFGLGAGEIFIILAFALIFIGPKKLPELAKSLGKGIREFQKAKDELMTQVNTESSDNAVNHNADNKDQIDSATDTNKEDGVHQDHHQSLTGVGDADPELEKEVAAMQEALAKEETKSTKDTEEKDS